MLLSLEQGENMVTVIFDFNDIIADPNYNNILNTLSLTEKISALRIFATLKKDNEAKQAFGEYKKGNITSRELESVIAKSCPKCADDVRKLLYLYAECFKINSGVINSIKELKKSGTQVILMADVTPEIEQMLLNFNFDKLFDGLILSTHTKVLKPYPRLYEHVIKKYNLKPSQTIMIDSKKKNLEMAEYYDIQTFRCKNSQEAYQLMQELVPTIDIYRTL